MIRCIKPAIPADSLMRYVGSLMVLLYMSGCTHRYGSETLHDVGRYLALQPGISTKSDVHARFGQPADVLMRDDGSEWLYFHASTQIHGATFVPYIGLAAGGSNAELLQAVFLFDAQQRYQHVETSRETRYINMWVGLAEATKSTALAEGRVRAEMAQLGVPFDEAAWKDAGAIARHRPAKAHEESQPASR